MSDKTKPDISFVIPAHNAEAYLAEGISACLAQTHKNIEVVVVDDGSTDATAKVIAHFAKGDDRVMPVHTPNIGRGAARNLGTRTAKADLIAVLDADDVPDRERAKVTLALAKNNPDAYLYGGAAILNEFLQQISTYIPQPFSLDKARSEKINGIIHSTAAYSKSLYSRFPYDEGEYQAIGLDDWHQQIRMALAGVRFVDTPKILTGYRVIEDSVSRTRDEKSVLALKDKFLEAYVLATA